MKKRILVVDDSALVREMYRAQLEEGAYEVLTAADGIEAINAAFTSLPDLILLDVHMPKINGYQVCRLLKDHVSTKDIPIIIMTGKGVGGVVEDPRKWSFQTGADGFYGKDEGTALIPAVVQHLQKAPVREGAPTTGTPKAMSETEIVLALSELLDRQLYLDITRLKQLDEQKDAFVANVSHELKAPLAILKGFLDNMQDGFYGPTTGQQIEAMGTMQRTIARLLRLIKDILDLSQIAAGKMKLEIGTVDLRGVHKSTFESFLAEAAKKSILLTLEIPETPVLIPVDEDRVTQVVVNLVSNALKYVPQGQKVVLRLCSEAEGARVEVEDTGGGISEENQKKLFDKFERILTEKVEGTGLGLSIARDIVNLHGGRIWLESAPGKGTKFVFTLPFK
jgi:signal transduction histidine kinase